jgi:hypothetical protein
MESIKNNITPQVATFKSILKFFSFCSPILIPTSLFLFSLYSGLISKGLLYLALIIGILCIRILFLLNYDVTTIQDCNDYPLIKNKNLTLSTYILSFTFFYLCFPMFVSNNINIGILSFFIFYIVFDSIFKFMLKCIDHKVFRNFIIGDFITGSAFGICISCLMYYSGGQNLLFTTESSNKVTCTRPSQQKFKCAVYKNGEIISTL